jgi:hypothetical protein
LNTEEKINANLGKSQLNASEHIPTDIHALTLQLRRQMLLRPVFFGAQAGNDPANGIPWEHSIVPLNFQRARFDPGSVGENDLGLFS